MLSKKINQSLHPDCGKGIWYHHLQALVMSEEPAHVPLTDTIWPGWCLLQTAGDEGLDVTSVPPWLTVMTALRLTQGCVFNVTVAGFKTKTRTTTYIHYSVSVSQPFISNAVQNHEMCQVLIQKTIGVITMKGKSLRC